MNRRISFAASLVLACVVSLVLVIPAQAGLEEDLAKAPQVFAAVERGAKALTANERKQLKAMVKLTSARMKALLFEDGQPATLDSSKVERLNQLRGQLKGRIIRTFGQDRAQQLALLVPLEEELLPYPAEETPLTAYCYYGYLYSYYAYQYAYYSYYYCYGCSYDYYAYYYGYYGYYYSYYCQYYLLDLVGY